MRSTELAIGIVVYLFSIGGYYYSSSLIHEFPNMTNNYLIDTIPSTEHDNQGHFLTGDHFTNSITTIIQITSIAGAIIGIGCVGYAAISKKPLFVYLYNSKEKRTLEERDREMKRLLKKYIEKLEEQEDKWYR